eukprot:CAMPEP_0197515632 /NCGR_PEP_ID=MMETSP1318-20131121/701_1 /TAXON_ID=552666 /ORGANISM="Partenskyella glossopodia, Strain RCC365" /LENGTH=107 /DNA_ID=CAMNT_0043064055 /DNA_START=177 /DNA_END=500 /DNA_ORIENTATION=+
MPRLSVRRRRRDGAAVSMEGGGGMLSEQDSAELLKREMLQRKQRLQSSQLMALLPIISIWAVFVIYKHGIFSKATIPIVVVLAVGAWFLNRKNEQHNRSHHESLKMG